MAENLIPITLIAFIVAIAILKYLYKNLSFGYLFISGKKKQEQEKTLEKYFEYYRLLNPIEKRKFILRVNKFIKRTKFYGRKGFKVTKSVKVLIAASAVQLTFGFYNYKFSVFRTILVYPDEYRNAFTGNYHKGELNPKGIIVYSWKHFLEGYADNNDNINLGLHEMAHALLHSLLKTNDLDYDLDNYLATYVKLSTKEMRKIRNREIHFFRNYAGQNLHEFFAVSVEHFFESPEIFRSELPALYLHLCLLLNQDPSKRKFFLTEKPSIFGKSKNIINIKNIF